jgi:hypothetical protein
VIRAAHLRLPFARALGLRGFQSGVVPLAAWFLLAVIGARAIAFDAADSGDVVVSAALLGDRVTLTWLAPLILPLLAFSATAAVLAKGRLEDAAAPLVAFGASRRDAVLAQIVAAVALGAIASALATALSLASIGAAPLDISTSTWIAALAGATYAALFVWGSMFGRRGGGRTIVLLLDVVLGVSDRTVSAFTPRGQLRSLFGGIAPHGISQRGSTAILVLLLGIAVLWTLRHAGKTPRFYA